MHDNARRRASSCIACVAFRCFITDCTVVYKLLYKPMAKSMEVGKFRPPQLRNRLTDFDEIRILERLKTSHHAKFHIDPTTWVVLANTQFATVGFLSLSFFLLGLFVTRTGRTVIIIIIFVYL